MDIEGWRALHCRSMYNDAVHEKPSVPWGLSVYGSKYLARCRDSMCMPGKYAVTIADHATAVTYSQKPWVPTMVKIASCKRFDTSACHNTTPEVGASCSLVEYFSATTAYLLHRPLTQGRCT